MRTLTSTLLLTCILASGADAQTSVKSGLYNDPTTWDTGFVPGPFDDVTIAGGHTVGLTQPGQGNALVTAFGLTVDGVLIPTYPEGVGGKGLRIHCADVVVNGEIRAEGNPAGAGGRVRIQNGPIPALGAGYFLNNGVVSGGDSDTGRGGHVWIDTGHGYGINNGVILGGDGMDGGNVSMVGDLADNYGLMQGGNALGDGFAGNASLRAGRVPTFGMTMAFNFGEVRGGLSGAGSGGDASVSAFSYGPFGTGTALNMDGGLIEGGAGCEPGEADLWGSTLAENTGVMLVGVEVGGCPIDVPVQMILDPPSGVIHQAAQMTADVMRLLGGDSLKIGPLVVPDAITATDELLMIVAPGGVLDLTELTPDRVDAPIVTIQADTVLLPPGLDLVDLFGPAVITTGSGATYAEAKMDHGSATNSSLGESVRLPLVIENVGNTSKDYLIDIFASSLATSVSEFVTLEPGERWHYDEAFQATSIGSHKVALWVDDLAGGNLQIADHWVHVNDANCWTQPFGNGPLTFQAEPGVDATSPFLAVHGTNPFSLVLFVFSATPLPSGLPIPNLTTLYFLPDALSNNPITTLAGPTGKVILPLSLQHPLAPQLTAQAFEISPFGSFPHSNGLTLQLCP